MDVQQTISQVSDNMTVRRVYGEPVESSGVVVIPAARIRGGSGGGEGEREGRRGQGAGFGLLARPAGAYVIRDGKPYWLPAIDANRLILGVQLLTALGMILIGPVLARRMRVRRIGRVLRRFFRRR